MHALWVTCVKFSRSKITRSNKRDKDGKLISTKASGGELIIDILWLDAPAAVAKGVIGETQSIVVADFLRDYKIQSAMRKIQSLMTVASVGPRRLIIVDVIMTP